MDQTELQRRAAMRDAGLSAGEQAAVTAGVAPTKIAAPTPTPYVPGTSTASATGFDIFGNAVAEGTPKTYTPPTNQPAPTDYYSRALPEQGAPTPIQAESEADIVARKQKEAEAQIQSLNRYYDTLVQDQMQVGEKRERATSSVATLTGLAGSTEANVQIGATQQLNAKDMAKIQAERNAAIQQIFADIRTNAVEEAKQSRLEARQSTEDIQAYRTKVATDSMARLTNLASAGVTYEGLKQSDPETYTALKAQLGNISDAELKGLFALNIPKESIIDKRVEGGKYIIAYSNPITGKTRIETTDLGIPEGYTNSIDLGDKIMFVPENFDPKTDTPLYIKKGLTPSQADKAAGTGIVGEYVAGKNPVVDSWAERIQNGSAKITEIPASQGGLRNQVTVALSAMGNTPDGKPTTTELGKSSLANAESLLTKFTERKGTGAVGKTSMLNWATMPGTDRANFINDFKALKSTLSLEGVKYLKGQGQVSDAERALLAQAVTKLSLSQSEEEFKKTLEGIIDKLNGGAKEVTGTLPNGTKVTKKADGTIVDDAGNKYDENGNQI